MTQRLRLLVAYDGTPFHGFAEQPGGVDTVAGALADALALILRFRPKLTCAGRTDAGVHAHGQVVTFEVPKDVPSDLARVRTSLNRRLSPYIVVRKIDLVSDDFDARRSATARRYRYTVLNAEIPDPFTASTAWWIPEPLHLVVMNKATTAVVGEHDFTTFCRHPGGDSVSLVRRVCSASWRKEGHFVIFDIEGNAFCHQMVRSLVGELIAIGTGRRQVADMANALAAKDRSTAAQPAPPHGLCLREVVYL